MKSLMVSRIAVQFLVLTAELELAQAAIFRRLLLKESIFPGFCLFILLLNRKSIFFFFFTYMSRYNTVLFMGNF